jgi:hypothetical protein
VGNDMPCAETMHLDELPQSDIHNRCYASGLRFGAASPKCNESPFHARTVQRLNNDFAEPLTQLLGCQQNWPCVWLGSRGESTDYGLISLAIAFRSFGKRTISIRRCSVRPSSVSLSATGLVSA